MPTQQGTTKAPPKAKVTDAVSRSEVGEVDVVRVDHTRRGPRTSTRKAAYNALADGRTVPTD
jgi:hypothetical protein